MNDIETEFAQLLPAVTRNPDRSEALAFFAILGYESGELYTPEEYGRAAASLREYREATGADIAAALDFLNARGTTRAGDTH